MGAPRAARGARADRPVQPGHDGDRAARRGDAVPALLALTAASAALLLPGRLVGEALGHPASVSDYLQVAWLISSLATVGGGLETDATVRKATYASDADDDA